MKMKRLPLFVFVLATVAGICLQLASTTPTAKSAQYDLSVCPVQGELVVCLSGQTVKSSLFAIGAKTDAVVFGEVHGNKIHKVELAKKMAELYAAGYRQFSLEAMPSSRQSLADAYSKGQVSREQFGQAIFQSWGYTPEPYLLLIDAAIEAHMQLVFLDRDKEDLDLVSPGWQAREAASEKAREEHWVSTVLGLRTDHPQDKVLLLVGDYHSHSIESQLSARGLKVAVVTLEGGELFYDSPYTSAARQAGLEQTTRLVKSSTKGSAYYQLLLPQAENAVIIGRLKP